MILLQPGIELDNALIEKGHCPIWHSRFAFRDSAYNGRVEERLNGRIGVIENLQCPYACLLSITRVLRSGIGALATIENILWQNPSHGTAQYAFFNLADFSIAHRFHFPGDIPDIFDQPIVAEGDSHLEPDEHAHTVFPIQQVGEEVGETEIENFAYPGRVRIFARQAWHLRYSLLVKLLHVLKRASLLRYLWGQPARHGLSAEGASLTSRAPKQSEPGEGWCVNGFFVMEPGVAAKDFIGGFAGKCHSRILLHGLAEEIERGFDLPTCWQIMCPHREQHILYQFGRVHRDGVVLAMSMFGHALHPGGIQARMHHIALKMLRALSIINGVSVERFAFALEFSSSQRRQGA